jgi:hypothetical protein
MALMASQDYWLALVDACDSGSPNSERFETSARILTRVLVEGWGYQREAGAGAHEAGGCRRYRTLVLEGSPWGLDTSLFRWSTWSRLIPLPDRLGVSLEFWPGVPGAAVLPWRAEGSKGPALTEYLQRLAMGAEGLWALLASQDVTQRTIDDLCFSYRQAAVPAYVGATLYSDEYVIDRRVGGPFAAMARPRYQAWYY